MPSDTSGSGDGRELGFMMTVVGDEAVHEAHVHIQVVERTAQLRQEAGWHRTEAAGSFPTQYAGFPGYYR